MNFYAFHLGDYVSATAHLTWDEDMAYRRLLDAYYSREAPIPLDQRQAYRLARASTQEQRESVDSVLQEFFEETESGWFHARCEAEIHAVAGKREKARAAANIGVKTREQKNAELRKFRLEEARKKGSHFDYEWLELLSACGGRCVKCGSGESVCKDHITPIYQGGSDGIDNLQPMCKKCNSAKGPDSTDHRSAELVSLANRLLSERSANAQQTLNGRTENTSERLENSSVRSAPIPTPTPKENQKHVSPPSADDQTAKKKSAFDPLTTKPPNVSAKVWADFVAHRKGKSKLTAVACELIAAKLTGHPDPDAVLNQSIENGWTGIFPEKVHAASKQPSGQGFNSAVDQVKRAIAEREARSGQAQPSHDRQALAEDDGDLRPPLDVEFRRVG